MKIKMMRIISILVLIGILIACSSHGQDSIRRISSLNNYNSPAFLGIVDSTLSEKYPFIHFEKNYFRFYTENSTNFEKLFYNMQQMVKYKDRKLNFYHIGGSHLQADIYTHETRTFLQTFWDGLGGERGLVFPFDLGKTNNPWNYEFSSPNSWKYYRSPVDHDESIGYGLLGAIVECPDSLIQINFKYDKTEVKPGFDRIRIYHNKGNLPFEINFGGDEIYVLKKNTNPEIGYTDVQFTDQLESFEVYFSRDTIAAYTLQILGFQLSNKEPGISYNTIGVNGAGLYTYLDNRFFEEQLTQFPPDFFAFSVGTNDANVPYSRFRPEIYRANLDSVVQMVLRANPNCAILLTVPNDAFYQRRYLNKNVAREREMIIQLAKKYEAAVWDLYGIMGELGSARTWSKSKLMRKDLVHFTSYGYKLKGDMYIESFFKWMQQMELRQNNEFLKPNGKN